MSKLRVADIDGIAKRANKEFRGQLPELESAIGMLYLGQVYGWKVLYLTHSKATVRKYEKILGITVREAFPEIGPDAHRSMGFKLAQKFSNFWKLVSGSEPGYKKTTEILKGT